MLSRSIQSIPKEKKDLEVFLRKVLRDHYQDIRDIYAGDASPGLFHGEIYADDNSTATVLALQGTWYDVTIFNANGESNGTTPDHAGDNIRIDFAGTYFVAISLDVRSAQANNYYFAAFKNKVAGTELHNIEARRTTSVANKPGAVSISGFVNFAVADTISLGIQRSDGGGTSKSLTIEHANLSIIKVAGGP